MDFSMLLRFAYAYAKRGQILLCEEWAKSHPKAAEDAARVQMLKDLGL